MTVLAKMIVTLYHTANKVNVIRYFASLSAMVVHTTANFPSLPEQSLWRNQINISYIFYQMQLLLKQSVEGCPRPVVAQPLTLKLSPRVPGQL